MSKLLLFLFLCLVACTVQPSFAAIPVKHTAITKPVATHENVAAATHHHTLASRISHIRYKLSALLHPIPDPNIKNTRGPIGNCALICGFLSFIPFFGILFGSAAIVLALIARQKHQKYAYAGFVLGIAGILFNIAVITFLIASALTTATLTVF